MRASYLGSLIGMGLALTACVGTTENRGVESVHQPVVSRSNYVLDLNTGYGGLSPDGSARLSGWFDSLKLGYGDRVSVDGSDSPAARAAVADVAARYGLLVDSDAPVTQGDIAPGNIRVVVSRTKASVPGCPDWATDTGADFASNNISNYGCGVNANLAAMVANPEDLIHGQEGQSAIDSTTAGKAIRSYRSKAPTGEAGLKNEATRSN